ncbi:dihydrofolate reductase family protein [Actinocorallia lasiicapitis]
MRKIIASLFISLDGVIEAPEAWHFPWFNDEMGAAVGAAMAEADATLYGRKTYEAFASYWPEQGDDNEIAVMINGAKKYVVSQTLESADWNNTTLLSGDVAKEIRALKESEGKAIGMTGSATLVRWLLTEGLLDELRLLIHPVVVGEGDKLFDGIGQQVKLKVAESTTFKTGVIAVTYVPAEEPAR